MLPALTDEDLAQQHALTADAVTGPMPQALPPPPTDDGLPILLGYQGRWVADRSTVKVAEKSRRIGLTWAESFDCVTIAGAARAAGGMNCFYIGYNFEMAREFVQAAAMWARHLQQTLDDAACGEFLFQDTDDAGKTHEIKAFRIVFASGFSIIALPSRPRSLRGMQGVVILDEAAFHDDLAGMIKAAMALLMWGGKVRIISTHDGDANPFNELVKDIRAGRRPYALHRITLDDALADGLYRRICTSLGAPWSTEAQAVWRDDLVSAYSPNEDEELFVVPAEGGGAYFTLAMLEAAARNTVPVIRWSQPDSFARLSDEERAHTVKLWIDVELMPLIDAMATDEPTAVGGDFARSGDVSSRWVWQTDRANRRRTAFVVELRNIPFTEQESIDAAILRGVPGFTAAKYDATGNGSFIAERMQQRFGYERVEAVKFSTTWYVDNFPRLRSAIEDRTADLPNDRDVFSDFRLVTLVAGVPKVPENKRSTEKGEKKGKRHGDTAVAAVLGYAASRAEPFETGYETPSSSPRDRYEPAPDARFAMRADDDRDDDEFGTRRERVTK